MSFYIQLCDVKKKTRRVIVDTRDNLKRIGFRLSFLDVLNHIQIVEISFYDETRYQRYICSHPIYMSADWHVVMLSMQTLNESNDAVTSVSVDGDVVISSSVKNCCSMTDSVMYIGVDVEGNGSITGWLLTCFVCIFWTHYTQIYSETVVFDVDASVREAVSLMPTPLSDVNWNNISILIRASTPLIAVLLANTTSVVLFTQSTISSLVEEEMKESTETEKPIANELKPSNSPFRILRVGKKTPSNESTKLPIISNRYVIATRPQQRPFIWDSTTASTAAAYELYLQSAAHSDLFEGKYAFSLPQDLRESWDALFDQRAESVRESAQHFWRGYKKHAFGRDELLPLSDGGRDNWGGVGMTLVDCLDTLWVMELREEFDEAVAWVVSSLHFTADFNISVFEFTIRVLGGLLSAYTLSGDKRLLLKAVEAGEVVIGAFDAGGVFPHSRINLQSRHADTIRGRTSLAEFGTLSLELRWRYDVDMIRRELSRVSGDTRYAAAADSIYTKMESIPSEDGLQPQVISFIVCDVPYGRLLSYGGGSDSYYEYLLKAWIQGGKKEARLKRLYDESVEGLHKRLLRQSTHSGWFFVGEVVKKRFLPNMQTLTCFLPGMLLLGAYHTPDSATHDRDVCTARAVLYTCHMMSNVTSSGLPPESCTMSDTDGMVINNRLKHYSLRPEVVESMYMMKATTGDPIAQVWGWEFYKAIERNCRTDSGYGMFSDVEGDGMVEDSAESFFMAETLKYLYLLFSSKPIVDLDKFVFSTEAHILPIINK